MNNATNKKILYIGLALLFVIFISGIVWANNKPKEEDYKFPSPKEVVMQYFVAWNNKDYVNMYATFSDGFKKIEPTAKTLRDFRDYTSSQNIEQIEILNTEEITNDGQTATVNYEVIFTLSSKEEISHKDKFTLKYRRGDIIQGWKLIHPYGENIDQS